MPEIPLPNGPGFWVSLTAELRVLVCLSSGTEGLLWRLLEELQVGDDVELHQVGNVDVSHPLARGLRHAFAPLCTPGRGDPRLPIATYSLRDLLKGHEAVFVAGRGVTHEQLIRWLAQQIGSAHADEGINPALAELNAILIANVQPFVQILHSDGMLTLAIGERLLSQAQERGLYQRRHGSFRDTAAAPLPDNLPVTSPLSGPALDPINEAEGTIFFLVLPDRERWQALGVACNFPPYRAGKLTVETTKTSDGFLEIRGTGLFIPEITCRTPAPVLDEKGLTIGLTWKHPEIKVYVNGALVQTFLSQGQA